MESNAHWKQWENGSLKRQHPTNAPRNEITRMKYGMAIAPQVNGVDAVLYTTLHYKGDGAHYKSKSPNPCRLGYPHPYRALSALLIDDDQA